MVDTYPLFPYKGRDYICLFSVYRVPFHIFPVFEYDLMKPRILLLILGIIVFLSAASHSSAKLVTEKDLKDVLSAADKFVRQTDPFGHYLGYNSLVGGQFVGVVFLTTEVVPEESWGYRDQITTLVGVDVSGRISGVKILSEFESPRYTQGLLGDGSWFLTQFTGKDSSDSFVLSYDIDAITGATITSSAITHSIKSGLQLITKEVLYQRVNEDSIVKHDFLQHLIWQIDLILLWITAGLAFFAFLRKNQFLRYCALGMAFAYLGVYKGGGFSLIDVIRLLSFHNPVLLTNLYWYSLVVVAIGLTIIAGRAYCGWLCPFGAFTEILFRLTPLEWRISGNADKILKIIKYINLVILLVIAFVISDKLFAVYLIGIIEPFATFFHLDGDLVSWTWLIAMLLFSSVVSRFFCRYFCPLGAFFAVIVSVCVFLKLRCFRVNLPQEGCRGCKLAQKECQIDAINYDEESHKPSIDGNECMMCNRCSSKCPIECKKLELKNGKGHISCQKNG